MEGPLWAFLLLRISKIYHARVEVHLLSKIYYLRMEVHLLSKIYHLRVEVHLRVADIVALILELLSPHQRPSLRRGKEGGLGANAREIGWHGFTRRRAGALPSPF